MNLEAQFLWWCSLWIFNGVTELMAHEKKHGFPAPTEKKRTPKSSRVKKKLIV